MSILYLVLALVALQRAAELAFAARNTRLLRRLGACEVDPVGYRWIVALHALWLGSLMLFVPTGSPASWPLLGIYAGLQAARIWVLAALGRRWTTRIIVLPGIPLVARGPYRWLRHPNYLIVAAELVLLPLAFGAVAIALAAAAANLLLIGRRVAIEDRALAAAMPIGPNYPLPPRPADIG